MLLFALATKYRKQRHGKVCWLKIHSTKAKANIKAEYLRYSRCFAFLWLFLCCIHPSTSCLRLFNVRLTFIALTLLLILSSHVHSLIHWWILLRNWLSYKFFLFRMLCNRSQCTQEQINNFTSTSAEVSLKIAFCFKFRGCQSFVYILHHLIPMSLSGVQ